MGNDSTIPDSKLCTKCGEEKPLTVFKKNKRAKDGLAYQCKDCDHAYNAEYRAQNRELLNSKSNAWKKSHPERTRATNSIWRANNSEKIRKRDRKWRAENIEKVKAREADYRATHRDRRNAQSKEWRANNPEHAKALNLQWWRENGIEYGRKWRAANKHKLRAYRQSSHDKLLNKNRRLRAKYPDRYRAYGQTRRARLAKVGGRGITEQDMKAMIYIQQGLCAYCERDGQKLTLDHVIPLDQGGPHDPDNAVMCCGTCNSSKSARTLEQWIAAGRWFDH